MKESLLQKMSSEQKINKNTSLKNTVKEAEFVPAFIKDNRVPKDYETILKDPSFIRTNYRVKDATVYKKNDLYYYRDTFHTGKGAHLEVFNKKLKHVGIADPLTGKILPNTAIPGRTIDL